MAQAPQLVDEHGLSPKKGRGQEIGVLA